MRYLWLSFVAFCTIFWGLSLAEAGCDACGSAGEESGAKSASTASAPSDAGAKELTGSDPVEGERAKSGEFYDENTGLPDVVSSDTAGEAH